ncbi:lytic transglycosylase domain-containing protein [Pilimelia columellifera]|uniref:Lytic transglycosylase domain-containing protein n=1 Tax=Pilimelia columellifera subsp. columellifera TaxID=706583 RepID=A0ABN3N5N8_9ACTN
MSLLWSRLSARLLSVAILAGALVGGFYLTRDRDEQGQQDAAAIAYERQLVERQLLDQRAAAIAHDVSRQRTAQVNVARKAQAAARAADAAAKKAAAAKAAARKKAAVSGRPVPFVGPIPDSCDEYGGNRAIGCALLLKKGFGLDQMPCLDKLFAKESGWNHRARNNSSGAYGIPQALPGDKMASEGADWRNSPATQIRWGLGYIKGRYDTPCGAWAHSKRTGWY